MQYRQRLASNSDNIWESYQKIQNSVESLKREDFVTLRTRLWEQKAWRGEERVVKVLEDMKRAGHTWSVLEYNEYFAAKLFLDEYKDILKIFEGEFIENKIKMTIGTFNMIIATYLLCNQRKKAIELLESSKHWGIVADIRDFERTMHRCLPMNKVIVKEATQLIVQHGIKDAETLNANLLHLFRDKRVDKVKWLLNEYKNEKDINSYNIIIKGLSESRMNRDVVKYYTELIEKDKLKPNGYICSIMLDIFAHSRDSLSAEEVIRQTVYGGHEIDEIIYNQLIKVYFKSRETRKALLVFQELQSHPKLQINEIILNTMVNGLVINNELLAARKIYDEMIRSNFKPDIVTFNTMLKGYTITKDLTSSLDIIKDMSRLNIEPDIVTFTTFINTIFETREPRSAQDMITYLNKIGIQPNIYTFNSIINQWIKKKNIKEAERTLDIMLEDYKELKPTVHTFTNLIQGYTEEMNLLKAMKTFQLILKSGLEPDKATFTFMIVGFLNYNRVDDAYNCLDRMLKMNLLPTKDTWSVVFNHCYRSKDRNNGKRVLDLFHSSGFNIKSDALERSYNKLKSLCS
ncbi:hypothetical protein RMCBS344292_05931 [Rhizopus microsporus]|nr:hypothetical protein RMCBS344292_05931 [Rhizopus microsporus]